MTTELFPTWIVGDVDLTDYPFAVDRDDSVDMGEPEMVVEGLVSSLADGDDERVVRHGNRTYKLEIYIEGADLAELATSEALLRTELRRDGLTLTHDPGDGFSPASVFEIRTARLTPQRRDSHESHLLRKFTLTLTCSPFARSVDLVTDVALAVPGTETAVTFDTCDSATGWTGTYNGTPRAVDMAWAPGAVSILDVLAAGPQTLTLTRTGAVDFTPTRYLVAEIGYNGSLGSLIVTCVADGARTLTLLEQRLIAPGRYLYTYDSGAVDATSLTFSSYTVPDYADLKIFSLTRTDMPPAITPRQLSRILEVGGTERTPASIHVTSANGTDDLGLTFVHTSPEDGSGYSPPLRRWRVAGETVNTGGPFSGSRELIDATSFKAEVPTSSLPAGGYQFVAILRCPTTTTVPIYWDLWTVPPDGVRMGNHTGKASVNFTANVWALVVLAESLTLPTVRTLSGIVEVFIGADSGVELDEAMLFRVDDDCALSYVNATAPNLWLDSADTASSVPTVWTGEDRETSTHPGTRLAAMGAHILSPEGTSIYVAAASTNYPEASATFHKRWHSNAAE